MKKVLSILMVAVLSLNLLYQPCMADDGKKDTANDASQQSPDVGRKTKQPEKQLKQKKNKAASKENDSNCFSLFVRVFMWLFAYGYGYLDGYVDKHDVGEIFEKKEVKAAKCKFSVDKMSKKCLKYTLASLHPDRFQCYEDIKDFYVKVQEAYEKKK